MEQKKRKWTRRVRMTMPEIKQLSEWMQSYALEKRNVDFFSPSIDRWTSALQYLCDAFFRGTRKCDSTILEKNGNIPEALFIAINDPPEIVHLLTSRSAKERARYGGDCDKDLRTMVRDWKRHGKDHGCTDPFWGFADWFNIAFNLFAGGPIAEWLIMKASKPDTPLLDDLRVAVAKTPTRGYMLQFPRPYDVAVRYEDVPCGKRKQFGAGGITRGGPYLSELAVLAMSESRRDFRGGKVIFGEKSLPRCGKWASQWVKGYDPARCVLKFRGMELNFASAKKRWDTVRALVESAELDGAARLGNNWRSGWGTATGALHEFTRYIRPVKRPGGGGWYHLTEVPKPDVPTRRHSKFVSEVRKAR